MFCYERALSSWHEQLFENYLKILEIRQDIESAVMFQYWPFPSSFWEEVVNLKKLLMN